MVQLDVSVAKPEGRTKVLLPLIVCRDNLTYERRTSPLSNRVDSTDETVEPP
jgi:hypothetical protein